MVDVAGVSSLKDAQRTVEVEYKAPPLRTSLDASSGPQLFPDIHFLPRKLTGCAPKA
jgi:hypothetical protein